LPEVRAHAATVCLGLNSRCGDVSRAQNSAGRVSNSDIAHGHFRGYRRACTDNGPVGIALGVFRGVSVIILKGVTIGNRLWVIRGGLSPVDLQK
jgi:hypothetical protein